MGGTEDWYYAIESVIHGPVARETLLKKIQQHEVTKTTLVWNPGLSDWKVAGQVERLFTPPPVPSHARGPSTDVAGNIASSNQNLSSVTPPELSGPPSPEAVTAKQFRGGSESLPSAETIDSSGSSKSSTKPEQPESVFRPASAKLPEHTNIIARYWRGEYSLGVAYWGFGILGGFIAALIPFIVQLLFASKNDYEPRLIFATLITTWFGVSVVAMWQIVGLWRSANRRIAERARAHKKAPWAGLAKVAVILNVMALASQFATATLPQLDETWKMAFQGDPGLPDYSIRIMHDGSEVEISGGFKYGLTDDLERILRASPQIRVVHLDSIGGRIGEAEKLNKLIKERGIVTYVSHQCLSACTIAFAAGHERWLLQGAVLGFHAPTFPGWSNEALSQATKSQRELFTRAGFSRDFILRALGTPSTELLKPTTEELLDSKVITGVSNGGEFAMSGYGAITRETLSLKLATISPAYESLKDRFPDAYSSIVSVFFDGYVKGKTQAELLASLRVNVQSALAEIRPNADDDVLVDFGSLLVEQYQALSRVNPTLCYLYASGEGGNRDFSSQMPKALVQQEMQLTERAVRTAAKRDSASKERIESLWQKVAKKALSRVSADKVALLDNTKLEPSKHADYCAAVVALMQEITALDQNDAAILMRDIFSGLAPGRASKVERQTAPRRSDDAHATLLEAPGMTEEQRENREVSRQPHPDRVSQTRGFVAAYWSSLNEPSPPLLEYYAPSIVYFGNLKSADEVAREKRAFFVRWPRRKYLLDGNSLVVTCNEEVCSGSGTVSWDMESDTKRSTGTAAFELKVDWSAGSPKIFSETSTVKTRTVRSTQIALNSDATSTSTMPYEKKISRPLCEFTTILEITARIGTMSNGRFVAGDPREVGSAINYANGIYGVSYEYIPAISERSRVGDRMRLCLVSRYVNCPKGDDRGKTYAAENLRTGEKWSLPDAQHMCGGA